MILTEAGTRIEGPEQDVLGVVFTSLALSLGEIMQLPDAERLAMRMIVRVQTRLADAGYIVRNVDDGIRAVLAADQDDDGEQDDPSPLDEWP